MSDFQFAVNFETLAAPGKQNLQNKNRCGIIAKNLIFENLSDFQIPIYRLRKTAKGGPNFAIRL